MAKHKIYKYASRWYFQCGRCGRVDSGRKLHIAIYLGQEHIELEHRDLLTRPVGV